MNNFFLIILIGAISNCSSLVMKYDAATVKQFSKPAKMAMSINTMLFHGPNKKPVATEFFTIKSQMNGLTVDLKSIAQHEGLDYFIMAYPTVSSSTKVGNYIETTTAYQESYVYPKDQEHLATNDSDRIFIVPKIPVSLYESIVKTAKEQIDIKDVNLWLAVTNKEEANSFLEITPNYAHSTRNAGTYVMEQTPMWIEMILKSKDGKEIMHCKSDNYPLLTALIMKEMKKPEEKYIYDYILDGYRRDPNESKGMRNMVKTCMAEMIKALKEP